MRVSFRSNRQSKRTRDGVVMWLALISLAALFGLSRHDDSAALAQVRSPLEEEEEEPLGTPPKAATPANSAGAPTSPLDMEEEELPLGSAPPPRVNTGVGSLDDLIGPAAERSKDDEVKSEPVCDLLIASLTTNGDSRARPIALLQTWLGPPWRPAEKFTFPVINNDGKVTMRLEVLGRNIGGIQYYEQRMLKRAAGELKMPETTLASPLPMNDPLASVPEFDLNSPERQQAGARAIALLTTALAEHDSAVQRRIRIDPSFDRHLRQPLVDALFNLQFSQIRMLYQQRKLQPALAACERLRGQPGLGTRGEEAIHSIVERILLEPAFEAARADDHVTCRAQLDEYLARYPLRPGARAVELRNGLMTKAQSLVDQALATNNPALLDSAAKIWPRLPGIDATRRQLQTDYPVLNCAYATLPRSFSPLSVQTLPDRHAVSLMFESLVQWVDDERLGPHYSAQLCSTRPTPLSRGREFQLSRCVWSDSDGQANLCTAEDVQATIDLIKRVRPPGFPPAWEKLFEEMRYEDPFRFSLELQRDYWQPLALMDFKILPAHRFPADERVRDLKSLLDAFRNNPVGTGPFRLDTNRSAASSSQVRFVANPHYRKPDLPKIREIVFHQLEAVEALDEFRRGRVQLIYDVRPEHVVQLRRQGEKVHSLQGRSVHFLAPNYRTNAWLKNESLRRAIAHGIDREKILHTYFRPGGIKSDHEALTGPFPKYDFNDQPCWAYNPNAPKFERGQATGHLAQARRELSGDPPSLRLVYPARHQQTEMACNEIASQMKEIGITLELSPVDPERFHRVVTETHDFDLAYWQHDFEDATYYLWPLFDPADRGTGGGNFMGIEPDEHLRGLFDELKIHKEFREIRSRTHEIHDYVNRAALVIPLWQIDCYVAVRGNVRNAKFDALNLFHQIENWSVVPD